MESALASDRIAAVGSKILFAQPFVPLTLEVPDLDSDRAGEAHGPGAAGVFLGERSGFESSSYEKRVFVAGFGGLQEYCGERGRWSGPLATCFLPAESLANPGDLLLRVRGDTTERPRRLNVLVGDTLVDEAEITGTWQEMRVSIPAELAARKGFDLINNAASFLGPDGTSGDRGIFEPDRGQYDAAEDVQALCGCAMLLSRDALEDVGAFDEDYFMYFEDTELSWRLREAGYRLRYQPRSRVRHFHAATSVEWSPLFNFLVGRNRILMLVKHAAPRHAARAYLEELGRLIQLLRARRSLWHVEVRTRLRLQASLLAKAPKACLKRWGLLSD